MADIGFSDQVPSLPAGGGSIGGIGATFTPDLSTGTGALSIPLDTPNGPNDICPRLNLQYGTSNGNGPFGLGFSIPLPRLVIDTEYGFPRYDGSDTILLEGAGPLLALGGGIYRPQVDGGAWRIARSGSGFLLTSREGVVYTLGASTASRIADPANPANVFAWHLERIDDPLGYSATFTWRSEGGQLYLDSMTYGAYRVAFAYEPRADAFRSGRSGFTLTTALRCTTVELQLVGDTQPVVRRWSLSYDADPANGTSLLSSVTLAGVDEAGNVLAAPVVRLGYAAFGQPSLVRLDGADGAGLPALVLGSARRADLVDWNGDGLPDLLQVAQGGAAFVWLNTGDGQLHGPRSVGTLPGFAQADAALAFADMNGDGLADLVRYDQPLAGYVPRIEGGGFGEPVAWQQAPAPVVASPGVRVVDLDGDGIPDLLSSSSSGLTLYYRAGADGWEAVPRVVAGAAAPPVDFTDPHVFLADMTGDGSLDIVLVSGGGMTYWPYLGNGRWDTPVLMASSPALPLGFRPSRLFVADIDGDGCADVIYLDQDRVIYWINRNGLSFSPPVVIDYVPAGAILEPRFADMTGSGTAGLVWSSNGPFGSGTRYFYLDFVGATAPRLLTRVDNGIGSTTAITYTTSAQEAGRALRAGSPWSTSMPLVVPVVKAIATSDGATGNVRTTTFTYRDGRYDGVLREFAGFGSVDQEDGGDASMPTLRTSSWFHIGVDPAQPQAYLDEETRPLLRAIRGRLYKRERYGVDSSLLEGNPYDRIEFGWTVVSEATAGGTVFVPRLLTTTKTALERSTTASSVVTTTNSAWDANGNVTEATETATETGNPDPVQTLRTITAYASDPGALFLSKPYRIQQFDGAGNIVADQINIFDDAPEGLIASQGLMTRRSALAITDATVSAVYGSSTPDFSSLHYYRKPDSQGWWIDQGRYVRTVDASGLRGTVQGPNGGTFSVVYDANQTFPVAVTDPGGNTTRAAYDYRVSRVATLIDAAGQTYAAHFDALARLTSRVEPGDSDALPTVTIAYDTTTSPASVLHSTRAVSGAIGTVDERTLYAGDGTPIERREVDESGEIAVLSRVLNARGFPLRDYVAWRPSSSAYAAPDAGLAHTAYTYDSLGRPLTLTDPLGNVNTWSFGYGTAAETDPTGKTTERTIDATGRFSAIHEHLDGRTLTSTYAYDVKGNLVQHTDAAGNVVRMWYDVLGHVLRVQRPEQDTITVYDAAGNPVETRTVAAPLVTRSYDSCNRPVTVLSPGNTKPLVQYTYDDTAGGRCVRIDDESGSSAFEYDARGRAVTKRSTPLGATQYTVSLAYRSDGRLAGVTYPRGRNGSLTLSYQYGKRGTLAAIPGAVSAVAYDLNGRRTSIRYANGVISSYAYDTAGRRSQLQHAGAGGTLRDTQLTRDGAGNLLQIVSPDNDLATSLAYDGLHRLVRAATAAGDVRTYAYDDVGNLTQKSDIGAFTYGERGAPATCLTSAGTATFTYSPLGQMQQTPWGTQSFDALGRLVSIAGSTEAAFTYDYSGARASAAFSTGGTTKTRLTPDVLYAIEDGTLVDYLYDGERFIARDADGIGRTYLHEDHLGSIVLLTNTSGNVADAIRYDAFGAIVARQATGSDVPVGFAQGVADAATGLLYLQARYYHPTFGRFVSVDPLVQNVFEPIAWNSFAYCANNPQTIVDPTGRSWDFLSSWKFWVGVLAVVALIVLAIVTCGVAAPAAGAAAAAVGASATAATAGVYVAVGIGIAAGGIIGGIAAARAGGDAGDIVLGALVGAAVGGWAALGSMYVGHAIVGALAAKSLLAADILAGAASGAINGAAMGFASGFAGGKGTLDQTLADIAIGALVGAVVGGAIGGAQYALTTVPKPPVTTPGETPPGPATNPGAAGEVQNPALATTNSYSSAALKAASPWMSYAGSLGARAVLMSPFAYGATILLTDTASGVIDLGYGPQILQWLKEHNVSI